MSTSTQAPSGVTLTPDGVLLWSIDAVAAALCCSTSTARRWSRRAGFPAALELGAGIVRWHAEEIVTWRDTRRRPEVLATPAEWTPEREPVRGRARRGARRAA